MIWFMIALQSFVSVQPEKLDIRRPIACMFRLGQYIDPQERTSEDNSRPLKWRFSEIGPTSARFESAGEAGNALPYFHSGGKGLSLTIRQQNGIQLFTVWTNGEAYWTKHTVVGSSTGSQQFRGLCVNN